MFKGNMKDAILSLVKEVREAREQRSREFDWFRAHLELATKDDLKELKKDIIMKLSEVKSQIAAASARSTEAFQELGTRIADLQKQIDDLIAGAGDPDITDEAFLADLQKLKTNTDQLADIIPDTAPPA